MTSSTSGPIPETNQIVRVRARKYLVEEVVAPPEPDQDHLVRLACLEDDAQGEPLEVLWEREIDARVSADETQITQGDRPLDAPRCFSAWLNTLYWNRVTATDPKLFQAPYRAGIQVKSYQLEPLQKALQLPRVNLFIADDVGLGKTIEAGLIVREMILRQRVRRIVVICPPSVLLQWRDELETRFGLTFTLYDRAFVSRCRQERGHKINPWTTHNRFIISQALIRNESYAGALRDWLGDFSPGSLLILDEAHHAAPSGGGKYAIESHFTRTIREIAERFEHKLFLSATPHNGHPNSFTALLELLDPQRFCRGLKYTDQELRKLLKPVLVRRLKKDLRQIGGDFPERLVVPFIIDHLPEDSPELELSRLLQAYRQSREARLKDAAGRDKSRVLLVLGNLQKRLLSSIPAFAHTLGVHIKGLEKHATARPIQTIQLNLLQQSAGADDEYGDMDEDQLQAEEDFQMTCAAQIGATGVTPQEWELLASMRNIAEQARRQPDARVKHLIEWLKQNCCPELGRAKAKWNDRRVLIFTEYTASKNYLCEQLESLLAHGDQGLDRLAAYHGGIGEERREELKNAFNSAPSEHPLRILIATDAAREGVNLQNNCADLIHFDVPWNPGRMEQRNGRIDRKLQRADQVRCHYYVLPQRAEDRVLDTLVKKTETILKQLGSMSPVIERNLDKVLSQGIDHHRAEDLQHQLNKADQDEKLQTAARELEGGPESRDIQALRRRLEALGGLLVKAREWLHLHEDGLRDALNVALEQLGAEPLLERLQPNGEKVWSFPPLEQLLKAGPGWAVTLDTLRTNRPRDQKLWQWRAETEIRPVIFRDAGSIDRKTVHLHLEHRVAQRLLGGFKTAGFAHQNLSRLCVCLTDEPIAHVLLFGRLSLYGPGAARLHDDIVVVAAEWRDLQLRGRGGLKALGVKETETVRRRLLDALVTPHPKGPTQIVQQQLKNAAATDFESLLPELEQRAQMLRERAEKDLAKRGGTEAAEMRQILVEQLDRLNDQLGGDIQQMPLGFGDNEFYQWESERRHWRRRVAGLEREIESEPRRIRDGYQIKVTRFEPLGLAWLWPDSR